ncbi:MAG TPA: pyridoxal-phosphate dependent enzyme [Salinivirgaceae bacterium]|nr:pyridoxal-phosphate dependent enzyme [Salinivirgaceae bacterium]HQA75957.1 pyridoxal-phosphate dependent enzyme [Salinivirgaceae bacterium]
MTATNKFHFRCLKCNYIIKDFKEWFSHNQMCPKCKHKFVFTEYKQNINHVKTLIEDKSYKPNDFWRYFDFLPLNNKENIVTSEEGAIPVDEWSFLSDYAKKLYGLDIEVFVYRNDLNNGTGTFKDVAASVAASVLKENGIKEYCIASTGNIANSYAHYFAKAGISLSVFIPQDALVANEAEVSSYGQRIYRVKGDYAMAKNIAAQFNEKYKILISGGNIDPMRVEAKKTMVFEWLRLMKKMPTVYVQALSGGTGPIAIDKAYHDLKDTGVVGELPRFIMVQPDQCAPMTAGYREAKSKGFPQGWLQKYPIIENPVTAVPTLATGNPGTYPIIANLVHKTNGDILEFSEKSIIDVARLIAYETHVSIGPASCIGVGGFFEALYHNKIKSGDVVLINVGEGVRRAPELMKELIYTTKHISSIEECDRFSRDSYSAQLWKPFYEYDKIAIKNI